LDNKSREVDNCNDCFEVLTGDDRKIGLCPWCAYITAQEYKDGWYDE